MSTPLYDIQVTDMAGNRAPLEQYKGQVLLIVNTASKCGLTPQFAGLEELHQEFKDRGLVILGFPCNQFAGQDPGSNEEIASFCQINYGVSFKMHEKIDVNGGGTHPLYKHLKSEKKGFMNTEAIKWNFTKFLIDQHGNVVDRISPRTEPAEIRSKIEALLRDVAQAS